VPLNALNSARAFAGCGKIRYVARSVTGHDFCRAAKCPKFSEGVTGCGKIRYVARSVTGHDFSRAADASIQ
jgi:predicted aminopeptidase